MNTVTIEFTVEEHDDGTLTVVMRNAATGVEKVVRTISQWGATVEIGAWVQEQAREG